ncbi:MAG: DUF4280 domain-containing protein [Prevotella sp.]|nr:DUF4280 domain-containing protein [Prevotella sp.]
MAQSTNSFVVNGAILRCACGNLMSPLICIHREMLGKKCIANVQDAKLGVNITSFGMCYSLVNPAVQSLTAAAFGMFTPAPCIPAIASSIWSPTRWDVNIEGIPVLEQTSGAFCMLGEPLPTGNISIINNGQIPIPNLNLHVEPEILEFYAQERAEKWDKIQEYWGYLGFVPVGGIVADVANTITYAARGKWDEAALSAISIIPGVGDAFGAVGKGAKVLSKAENAEKIGKALENVGDVVKTGGEWISSPITTFAEKFGFKRGASSVDDIRNVSRTAERMGVDPKDITRSQIKEGAGLVADNTARNIEGQIRGEVYKALTSDDGKKSNNDKRGKDSKSSNSGDEFDKYTDYEGSGDSGGSQ